MATNVTSYYDPDGILSNRKLITLSTLIGDRYPLLGQRLGLSRAQLDQVRESGNLQHQVFKMLELWRETFRENATLGALKDIVKDLGWISVYTQIVNTPDNFYVVL
ncbi:uncharacterized protein LOC121413580 [Lytechinus variegatus]|uniref:uncharacterized protein LOC121413580 n=1 Tax=Lytechinus variegatus TaxID=7654 RepID=UPI001BB28A5F|nr:uncharacterized protein LOC121413580 [Lytechinus variegatus]